MELVDEDALIVMLGELDTVPGAPVGCDCRPGIRGSSFANTRHESTETPFYSRLDASDFGARPGPRGRRFHTSELRMVS
ncbi:hypothetical protein [Streptomyces sp.]|uniref:hypothetical protein n=1 Tax=Streptomyces sp. TaxID=1931 RepID=UPI002D787F75|nr:hypothetical protein [Streptomyces sp.]HET6357126.1 hypothetical protein [Streptomyces sp.]